VPGLIVTGSIQTRPDSIDEALTLSLTHVRRSRASGVFVEAVTPLAARPPEMTIYEAQPLSL